VTQQFLNGADVVTVLQEMRRKGMPERVARRLLGKAGLEHGFSNGTLDDRLVQMMAEALPRGPGDVELLISGSQTISEERFAADRFRLH